MEFMDCNQIHFAKKDNELLSCIYQSKHYESVKIFRCFPLTNPSSYLSIRYGNENELIEIGIIKDIEVLSKEDQALVMEDLTLRYFIPEIMQINKHTYKRQYHTFECKTNAGNTTIRVKDIIYNVFATPSGDLLLKDCDENYYIIRDYKNSKDKYVKFIRSNL